MEKLILKSQDNNLLKVNYSKCLNDENFLELVNSLEIDSNIKMKYTTRLNESALEHSNCKNCKNLLSCKNNMKGYCLTPKVLENSINFSYQKCEYKEKVDKQNEYLKNIYFYEIPAMIKSANFKNIYKDDRNRLEIIKKIKSFYDNYKDKKQVKGIYLNGNFGSGKSYLIAALFNELAKLNYKSAIIYFPEFLRSLKAGFSRDGSEYKELFDNIKTVPLLLIDDIGAEKLTDWARDEILGSILQYRMDFKLPTFFTSNLTITELENHLQINMSTSDKIKARRIIERIKFLTEEVSLIGINRRSE
ncbi:MAG: primosomal protein DnaI [Bacilli bacterium]|nr:primosomal protein DnaI [Bacilli bacterium]